MARLTLQALALVFCGRVLGCDKFCDNEDCGSCGNACCKLTYKLEGYTTRQAVDLLNATIAAGGPDGNYAPAMTYEGTLGFADLTPYKKDVDFIGQAIHTTTGDAHFKDTIDFIIRPHPSGATVMAFSISQIAGAYCDEGQNYSNLQMLFDSLNFPYNTHTDFSCGGAKPHVIDTAEE